MAEPILRWAGSKRKLLPFLESAAPARFSNYIEPFVGSGIYFLKLDTQRAVLNDLNDDLIESYRAVMRSPRSVWRRVAAMSTVKEFYYELRSVNPSQLSPVNRAARFIYLNRFCFNGVYRTNLQWQFNVSRGEGHLFVPSCEAFEHFALRLRRSNLLSLDFSEVLDDARRGSYCYVDPPYALEGKRDRGQYGVGTFREADESRLVDSLLRADRRGAKILMSYGHKASFLRQFPGWQVTHLSVDRKVASRVTDRASASEVLISNYRWEISSNLR
ncbi:MAG: DNA adenine methylase [Stenotrophobium sp.]